MPSPDETAAVLEGTIAYEHGPISSVAWSPDGTRLAGVEIGRAIAIFDPRTGEVLLRKEHPVNGIGWSADGCRLAVGGYDASGVLSVDSGELNILLAEWSIPFAYLPGDGGFLIVGGSSAPAMAIDVTTAVERWSIRRVKSLTCSPDGHVVVRDTENELSFHEVISGRPVASILYEGNVRHQYLRYSPGGSLFAAAQGSSISVYDAHNQRHLVRLEAHQGDVRGCSYSSDDRLMATVTRGSLKIWRCEDWTKVLDQPVDSDPHYGGVDFHPNDPSLLAVAEAPGIQLYRLPQSGRLKPVARQRRYVTARIALVGDSMVGKTHLGHRIAKGDWHAYPSTHGQQFWVVDDLGRQRDDGVECEAVLWDFAGQPDYRLVHALFLDDVDVALLLFDPSDRDDPMAPVEFWRNQLRGAEAAGCQKVLVGTKVDRGSPMITEDELRRYCEQSGFSGGYIGTSALDGTGVEELKNKVLDLIDWDQRPATVTTEVFKRIKDLVLELKQRSVGPDVLVSVEKLRSLLETLDPALSFSDDDLRESVKHVAKHGYVFPFTTSKGERRVLLDPTLLVGLASSFVLEARRNPMGLGSLEEARVMAGDYDFPELAGIDLDQRHDLLDAATSMFLRSNVCLREADGRRVFLVFPSLIHERMPPLAADVRFRDGVSYKLAGSITHVYASLVVLLGYTEQFVRRNQWQNQAQYEFGPDEVCGFRAVQRRHGELEIVLYSAEQTPASTFLLFEGLVERFLSQRRGITITKYPSIDCQKCGVRQDRNRVIKAMEERRRFLRCDDCDKRVALPPGATTVGLVGKSNPKVDMRAAHAERRTQYEAALVAVKRLATEAGTARPTAFLSYAWGDADHERWVESLAGDLREAGVDVLLDRWHNEPGKSLTRYIDRIEECDRVLVIGTPALRKKYDRPDDSSVVAAELRLVGRLLRTNEEARTAIVPLLRAGETSTAFPPQVQDQVGLDFRKDSTYFDRLIDLLLVLFGIRYEHPGVVEIRRTLRDA